MYGISLVLFASVALAGCATITRGTTNQVEIISDPAGATARTSMGDQCVTPCTLQVARKDEFSVTFSRQGYEEQTALVKTEIAGAGAAGFAGNVLAGGVVGMGVDAATGATLQHKPNPVSVVLKPIAAPTPARRAPRVTGRPAPGAQIAPPASS